MPSHVYPAVEGIEAQLREDTAWIKQLFPKGKFPAQQDVAKRCQHCDQPIKMGAVHAWVIVEYERDDGEHSACYPVFCNPTCLHEWAVSVELR